MDFDSKWGSVRDLKAQPKSTHILLCQALALVCLFLLVRPSFVMIRDDEAKTARLCPTRLVVVVGLIVALTYCLPVFKR